VQQDIERDPQAGIGGLLPHRIAAFGVNGVGQAVLFRWRSRGDQTERVHQRLRFEGRQRGHIEVLGRPPEVAAQDQHQKAAFQAPVPRVHGPVKADQEALDGKAAEQELRVLPGVARR